MRVGNVFNIPAADRTARDQHALAAARRAISATGPGSRRGSVHQDGGLLFLNPAAFATPKPGTFGNLTRNEIHGPGFKQVDWSSPSASTWAADRTSSSAPRVFNIFNITNFANPVGTLPKRFRARR
jgi:hypothetical protein